MEKKSILLSVRSILLPLRSQVQHIYHTINYSNISHRSISSIYYSISYELSFILLRLFFARPLSGLLKALPCMLHLLMPSKYRNSFCKKSNFPFYEADGLLGKKRNLGFKMLRFALEALLKVSLFCPTFFS